MLLAAKNILTDPQFYLLEPRIENFCNVLYKEKVGGKRRGK